MSHPRKRTQRRWVGRNKQYPGILVRTTITYSSEDGSLADWFDFDAIQAGRIVLPAWPTIGDEIGMYEAMAIGVLETAGLPTDCAAVYEFEGIENGRRIHGRRMHIAEIRARLLEAGHGEPELHNEYRAAELLRDARQLRQLIKENNAATAARWALRVAQTASAMQLCDIEEQVRIGQAQQSTRGGRPPIEDRHRQEWQRLADSMWRENPRLSNSDVARAIAALPATRGAANTIRQNIVRPKT